MGRGVLGTQDTLATTTGTILLDWFTMDDARICPPADRFPRAVNVTASRHIFVGPGMLDELTMTTSDSGQIVRAFDTDSADTTDAANVVAEITQGIAQSVVGPLVFRRGCYIQLTGTATRARATVGQGADFDAGRESSGPLAYSEDGIRQWGQR